VIDNAIWARNNCSTGSWLGALMGDYYGDKSDYDWAADRGTEMAQMFQRAVVADYILAKKSPVVYANNYVANLGGSITFNLSASFDPDAISWNTNATFSQLYGVCPQGLTQILFDFNNDGTFDSGSLSNTTTVSTSQLVNTYHLQTNAWNDYTVRCYDNEHKFSDATGSVYISAVPEPGSLTLLAIGAAAFFFLKRKR
jgi:hypothetical protein